jgi:hypothetical protein
MQYFGEETCKNCLEDLGVDGLIILKLMLIRWESVDWINLVYYTEKVRPVVNRVMDFRVS